MNSNVVTTELRVMLFPNDFMKTKQFYAQLMQWTILHEWDDDDHKGVMFDSGCSTIELIWPRAETYSPGSSNLAFRVTDVWSLWTELSSMAPVVFPLRQNSWGDDSFCITDPDGTRLIFFTDRPKQS